MKYIQIVFLTVSLYDVREKEILLYTVSTISGINWQNSRIFKQKHLNFNNYCEANSITIAKKFTKIASQIQGSWLLISDNSSSFKVESCFSLLISPNDTISRYQTIYPISRQEKWRIR